MLASDEGTERSDVRGADVRPLAVRRQSRHAAIFVHGRHCKPRKDRNFADAKTSSRETNGDINSKGHGSCKKGIGFW